MKIVRSMRYHNSIASVILLTLPLSSLALPKKIKTTLSETELYHLVENPTESYIYCDKYRSKIADIIMQASEFDSDKNSPVWQLKKHIEEGYVIGLQDTVLNALEYAEKIITKALPANTMVQLQATINSILTQIELGQLNVTLQSAYSSPSNTALVANIAPQISTSVTTEKADVAPEALQVVTIEVAPIAEVVESVLTPTPEEEEATASDLLVVHDENETSRSKTIKVKDKTKFYKDVEFKDHAEFQHFASFHGNAKFRKNVAVECNLSVGCNISMVDSISSAIGNVIKNDNPFIHTFPGSASGNTFVGENAGNFSVTGINNSAFGNAAMQNANAEEDTAIGYQALQNDIEGDNTAVGYNAMQANTEGYYNTAIGAYALVDNIDGVFNTASGFSSLANNIDGSVNTAHGGIAMVNNISGNANTAIGFVSMVSNTTGNANTACGLAALRSNTTGNANTAIGIGALRSNITGNGNIALGAHAGSILTAGDNNVYIAADGASVEAGTIRIGTDPIHVDTYIQGIYGTAVSSGLAVQVDISGHLGTMPSTMTLKKNIADMAVESEGIYSLRPVTFSYKSDANNTKEYGLIAEEVAEIFPSLVALDRDGQPFSVRYQVLPMLLLNEVQKQHATIEKQDIAIKNINSRLNVLEQQN